VPSRFFTKPFIAITVLQLVAEGQLSAVRQVDR
jgi:CubicO group peptidase (beta-lactamase class C family)